MGVGQAGEWWKEAAGQRRGGGAGRQKEGRTLHGALFSESTPSLEPGESLFQKVKGQPRGIPFVLGMLGPSAACVSVCLSVKGGAGHAFISPRRGESI